MTFAENFVPGDAPLVSILVVAYNSRGFIADCIGSVIENTAPGTYEILLVDNGKDNTAGFVAERFPGVRIIPSQGNIGFGRGNNLLAQHARGEFLLLLNPDTRLLDPAIDRLLAFARAHPGAAWGGLATSPEGSLQSSNFLAIPTFWGILMEVIGPSAPTTNMKAFMQAPKAQRVDVLSGGFMLITRSVWEELGGFDPSFLLYSEEVDLFARLKALGGEVWLDPDTRIVHDVGSGEFFSPSRMRFAHIGRMHYARKHWKPLQASIIGLAYWLTTARRWLVSALMSPVSASHRSRRRAFTPLLVNPGTWWSGYAGRTSLD